MVHDTEELLRKWWLWAAAILPGSLCDVLFLVSFHCRRTAFLTRPLLLLELSPLPQPTAHPMKIVCVKCEHEQGASIAGQLMLNTYMALVFPR